MKTIQAQETWKGFKGFRGFGVQIKGLTLSEFLLFKSKIVPNEMKQKECTTVFNVAPVLFQMYA